MICMGCGDVYNTKDHNLHHMCNHHVTALINLCLAWLIPSDRAILLEQMYMPCTECGNIFNYP